MVEGAPLENLHAQAQRGVNTKASKVQPPSPPRNMAWDQDGDRDDSIPAMGSWSKTQNTALERLLQPQGMPRCCGCVTRSRGSLDPPAPARSAGEPGAGGCLRAVLLQHGSGTAAGRGGLPAACGRELRQPLRRLLPCRKAEGCERGDFPDAPVLLCRVLAQVTSSAQADPAPASLCVGETHIPLPRSIADLGGDGCARLCFRYSLKTQMLSGLGLLMTEISTVLGTPGTTSS